MKEKIITGTIFMIGIDITINNKRKAKVNIITDTGKDIVVLFPLSAKKKLELDYKISFNCAVKLDPEYPLSRTEKFYIVKKYKIIEKVEH